MGLVSYLVGGWYLFLLLHTEGLRTWEEEVELEELLSFSRNAILTACVELEQLQLY